MINYHFTKSLGILISSFCMVACGGGSSGIESFTGTINKNGSSYICKSELDFNLCLNNNFCSQCQSQSGSSVNSGGGYSESCTVNNGTVRVPSPGCTWEGKTLACSDSKVSMDGGPGSTSDAGTITFNDLTFTCDTSIITTQPAAQSVAIGQTASFSVVAAGAGPLSYQWKKNDADIPGATSSTYTTPVTVIEDSGAVFTVVVKNSAGQVTSDKASLTVSALLISAQPAAQTVVIGQTASFSVGAAGTGVLSYQWKKNDTEIPGATSSTYTTPATVIGDSGTVFTVVVKNSAGEVTSDKASLTAAAIVITTPPANKSVIASQTASFTVTAAGMGPLTYQWKRGGVNVSTGKVTTGVGGITSTYTTPVTVIGDDGAVFTVEVRNSAGPAVTSSATLEVFATRYSLVPRSSGGNYAKTECVKDNLTGLVWEGKNPGGSSSRPADGFYTSLISYPGTSSANDYKNSVNSRGGLCGYMDWRLPDKNELLGIVDKSQVSAPKIDSTWFPNTQTDYAYWTSSNSTDSYSTYYFNSKPLVVDFLSGNLYYTDPTRVSEAFHVRLVR